jgi:hypothetical protein
MRSTSVASVQIIEFRTTDLDLKVETFRISDMSRVENEKKKKNTITKEI